MAKELTIKINIEGQDIELTSNQLKLFKKNADDLKKSLDELGERTEENAEQFDKLKGDLSELDKIFSQTKEEVKETGDEFEKTEDKSKALRTQIRELTNQLQGLGPRTAENATQFDALNSRLQELREVQEDVGFQTQKLDDALSQLPGPIGKAASLFKVFDDGLKNARAAMVSLTNTFPILKSAIAATGIGALVIILGALVAAVIKAFNTFKPLQDAVGRLGVLFDTLEKAIQPLIDLIGEGLVVVLDALARSLAFVTGQTEEYNEALANQAAMDQFNSNLEEQKFQLDILGDTYDEFERRKVEARMEANDRLKELNDNEVLDEEEKARRKLLIEQRYQRDLVKIDLDSATKDKELRDKKLEEDKKLAEKRTEIENKRIEEQEKRAKRLVDLVNNSADIYFNAVSDLESEQIAIRRNQLQRDLDSYESTLVGREKLLMKQQFAYISLWERFERDVSKIREESELKRIQGEIGFFNASIRNLERYRISTETELLEIVGAYDSTTKFADVFLGKLSKRMSEEMMLEFGRLEDLRVVYEEQYNIILDAINAEKILLDQALLNKLISEQTYYSEVERLEEESVSNKERYVQQKIALDKLEVESRRTSADMSMKIAEDLGNFLAQIAGKSKALQIASALTDAAIAIARIITNTQLAIIAFSASVAPLGPVGVPIAAAYAVKAKISAGIGIATIAAGTIAKLKGLKGDDGGDAGGDKKQSNGLGRGYKDGGLVQGPGTSRSDSIQANLSNGEFVMNGASTAMFLPMLEMLNNAGRQTSVPSLKTTLGDNPEQTKDNSQMIVKTYVVENELTSMQQKNARLKNLSTL